jgi:hypothetical protein
MEKISYKILLSNYEADWVEQAKDRESRGQTIDEGTLQTLGQLLLDNLEI